MLKETRAVLELIDTKTFPTGSAAYGCAAPSDHDRYCLPGVLNELKDQLESLPTVLMEWKAAYDGTNGSVTFELAGWKWNVFAVAPERLEIWSTVTKMMAVAQKTFPAAMENKPLRVHLFRTMFDTFLMWWGLVAPQSSNTTAPQPR